MGGTLRSGNINVTHAGRILGGNITEHYTEYQPSVEAVLRTTSFGVIFPVCHDMGQEARAMKMFGEGHR